MTTMTSLSAVSPAPQVEQVTLPHLIQPTRGTFHPVPRRWGSYTPSLYDMPRPCPAQQPPPSRSGSYAPTPSHAGGPFCHAPPPPIGWTRLSSLGHLHLGLINKKYFGIVSLWASSRAHAMLKRWQSCSAVVHLQYNQLRKHFIYETVL